MVDPVSMHSRGSVGIVRSSKGCSIARDCAIICDRVIAYDRIFVLSCVARWLSWPHKISIATRANDWLKL